MDKNNFILIKKNLNLFLFSSAYYKCTNVIKSSRKNKKTAVHANDTASKCVTKDKNYTLDFLCFITGKSP